MASNVKEIRKNEVFKEYTAKENIIVETASGIIDVVTSELQMFSKEDGYDIGKLFIRGGQNYVISSIHRNADELLFNINELDLEVIMKEKDFIRIFGTIKE